MFDFGHHVLGMLGRWYPEEYEMLRLLAHGEDGLFCEIGEQHPEYLRHLVAYGLVEPEPWRCRIPFLERFIRAGIKLETGGVTDVGAKGEGVEKWAEINELRNTLEPRLRIYCKRTLLAHNGTRRWIDPLLEIMPERDRRQVQGVDRDEILQRRIYLKDLVTLIYTKWEYFRHLESAPPEERVTREQFKVLLDFINAHREDAHAKPVSDADVAAVSLAVRTILRALEQYLID